MTSLHQTGALREAGLSLAATRHIKGGMAETHLRNAATSDLRTCEASQPLDLRLNNPWLRKNNKAGPSSANSTVTSTFTPGVIATRSYSNRVLACGPWRWSLSLGRGKNRSSHRKRSGWRWFKWVRTILSEEAERSICMKITVASNSWVHLFTSPQTWGVWAAAAAAAIVCNASLIISMFRVITSLGKCSNQQSISFSFWKCSCCSCVFFNLSRPHGSCYNN